ncbi:MAG: PAS domain S-box protein [Candidatus Binataceae bacterium]|nr:PAS domain S-box protein [Candidatus Binataceae bacterium]
MTATPTNTQCPPSEPEVYNPLGLSAEVSSDPAAFDLAPDDLLIETPAARLLRLSLLVGLEIIGLVLGLLHFPIFRPQLLALGVINLGAAIAYLGFSRSSGFKRGWRLAVLLLCSLLIVSVTYLGWITARSEPLALVTLTLLIGTGAMVPWELDWEIAFSVVCLSCLGLSSLHLRRHDLPHLYASLGLLAVATLACCSTFFFSRYRRNLAAKVHALRQSHQRLRDEISQRERAAKERRATEFQLAEKEVTLRKVFEVSLNAISIRRLRDGHLIEVNPEFERITGYSRAEVLQLNIDQLHIWSDEARRDEFIDQLRAHGEVRNWEADVRSRSGEVRPHLLSASLLDLGGEPHVVTTARDISNLKRAEEDLLATREALSARVEALSHSQLQLTLEIAERKQADMRLHESAATLRTIFEASLDAISVRRLRDNCYLDVNPEFLKLTGRTREELIGRPDLSHRLWGRAQTQRFDERLRREHVKRNYEALVSRKDGTSVPVLISSALVEIGGEACVVALSRDITQLKQAERELVAARETAVSGSRAKSEFLSHMSHEIRTPMNAILGMTELLWDTPLSLDQRRYLEAMRTNGEALLYLVNDILDLARVESGQFALEQSAFELDRLIEKTIETLAPGAFEKGLELVGRIAPELPTRLIGDPQRLRQILMNLLSNAIKFTAKGEVVLNIARDAAPPAAAPAAELEWLRFAVSDTGIGIPTDRLKGIFSNFTQADSAITHRYGGTGLGLAIVKRLVELHGGVITVESLAGTGSTFSFSLPLAIQRTEAGATPPRGEPALKGVRVLVADQSLVNRQNVSEMMSSQGAVVVEARTGAEAIALVQHARLAYAPFDLVLLDCRPPQVDGFAIAAQLRALTRAAPDPDPSPLSMVTVGRTEAASERIVLLLNTNNLALGLARMRELGLSTYLVKPLRRTDLLKLAGAAVSRGSRSAAAPEFAATRSEPDAAQPSLKILLAEDSADSRFLIEAYVKNTRFQIEAAENGALAIKKFISGHYDLVLMDVQMPMVDGYMATRAIRRWEKRRQLARTPIIAVTAGALNEVINRSLRAGCDAHLSKPINKETLLKAINDALSRRALADSIATLDANRRTSEHRQQHDHNHHTDSALGPGVRPELRNLPPGFLTRKRDEIPLLRKAIHSRNFKTIAILGRRMRDEATRSELKWLNQIGAALERAGELIDTVSAGRLIRLLANYVAQIESFYRADSH